MRYRSFSGMKRIAIMLAAGLTAGSVHAENMFFNSSFELGTKGYTGARTIPYEPGSKIAYAGPGFEGDATTAAHGEKSLKITLFETDSDKVWRFNSHEVELKPGQKYSMSFYAKSSVDVNIQVSFISTMGDWRSAHEFKSFSIAQAWKRYDYSFVFAPKSAPKQDYERKYFLYIGFPKQNATVWLDGLQLEESGLTTYAPAKEVETAVYTPPLLTDNIPLKGTFHAISYNKTLNAYPLTLILEDEFFKKSIERQESKFDLPAGKSVKREFGFDSKRLGSLRVMSNTENDALAYRSAAYLVRIVTPTKLYGKGFQPGMEAGCLETLMTSPGKMTKNMIWSNTFGNSGEYARLVRLSGSTFAHTNGNANPFFICLLEPERNQFDWRLADSYVQLAEQNKLAPVGAIPAQSLMTTFNKSTGDDVPKWLRALDRTGKPDGACLGEWPNVQIVVPPPEVIGEFFAAISKHYGDRVKAYQLFAEANGYMTPAYMVEYMASAYKAVKKNSPETEFIGITPTEDYGSKTIGFFGGCLQSGAANYCDAYAFHPYSASMDDSPVSAMKGILNLQALIKEKNVVKPIWNTEVYYLLPTRQSHYSLEYLYSADAVARRLLIDMGEGVTKSCPLEMSAIFHNPLLPNQLNTMRTWSCIPSARFAVFNAAARFITGAEPVKTLELPGHVLCYVFRNDGKLYSAIWSIRDKVTAKLNLPSSTSSITVYDLFGNQIKTATSQLELELNRCPLYLEWNDTSDEASVRTLEQGKYDRETAFSLTDPKLIRDNSGRLCAGIIMRNESSVKQSGTIQIASKYLKNGGSNVSYDEIPPGQSKPILIPVQLNADAPDSFEVKVNASTQSKVLNFNRTLKNVRQLEITAGNWIEAIRINDDKNIPSQDLAASFALSRDGNDLLVKAKVTDNRRSHSADEKSPWTGDSVEIFLDLKPLNGDLNFMNVYHELCFQLIIPTDKAGNIQIWRAINGKLTDTKPLTGVKATVKDVPGGYEADIRIPLENVSGNLDGKSIGFTLAVNDNDDGQYKHTLTWTGKSNFKDRSGFATVYFR